MTVKLWNFICAVMKRPFRKLNCPSLYGQNKNRHCVRLFDLSGVALRQRRHSSFCLDALVIIEVNISVNQIICFLECPGLVPVDTFSFQDGEKVFCHCIIIRIAFS